MYQMICTCIYGAYKPVQPFVLGLSASEMPGVGSRSSLSSSLSPPCLELNIDPDALILFSHPKSNIELFLSPTENVSHYMGKLCVQKRCPLKTIVISKFLPKPLLH